MKNVVIVKCLFVFLASFLLIATASAENRTSEEKVSRTDSALLMIEFQREWLGPNGRLTKFMKDKVQFENSKEQAKRALEAARKAGIPVVHIGLFLNGNYLGLGGHHAKFGLRKVIQKYETWQENGCKFAEGYEPLKGEFIVEGRLGMSGFAGSNLDNYLRNNQIKRIYLAGYALHVCVESTLREGHDRGYEVILLEDATSAFNSEQRNYVFNNVIHHFGTHKSVDEFTKSLDLPIK